jgi:hypothetical protein
MIEKQRKKEIIIILINKQNGLFEKEGPLFYVCPHVVIILPLHHEK